MSGTTGAATPVTIIPLTGIGEIRPGDHLDDIIADAANRCCDGLAAGDVVVVTSKIVSKAEGRLVSVDEDDRDAKTRLVLDQAARVLRRRGDLLITLTQHGFVCANAGIDLSNTDRGTAVLLPEAPDRSARGLRDRLAARYGLDRLGVVVSDTFGRAWRVGLVDIAVGAAGFAPLLDLRGQTDAAGRPLDVTVVATADVIAAAADLVKGKAAGIPAAVVRGLELRGDGDASELVRHPDDDLFR